MSMLVSTTISIRVDWNTNKGPILPPTPTPPPPPPRRPYAEPAPVWEDQSNDIPNPNPYVYVDPDGHIHLLPHLYSSIYSRYVPPPPSRPKYNQNPTNGFTKDWFNYQSNEISNDYDKYQKYPTKQSNADGFFVDVPPKFFKTASPAKQQYYQQQYLQDILNTNFYSQSNGKYNIIAFKNTYHNVPYYVVSSIVAAAPWPWQSRTFS